MRIFIMFGTQDKRFDRLLNTVLQSEFIKNHEVFLQLGYTKGIYDGVHSQDYYTEEELLEQISLADVIITHAGVGSIVSSLKLGKKVIVVPRLGQYKEQNNDHQVQIMERFANQGYIVPVMDEKKLDETVEKIADFTPQPYIEEKEGVIEEIRSFISSL